MFWRFSDYSGDERLRAVRRFCFPTPSPVFPRASRAERWRSWRDEIADARRAQLHAAPARQAQQRRGGLRHEIHGRARLHQGRELAYLGVTSVLAVLAVLAILTGRSGDSISAVRAVADDVRIRHLIVVQRAVEIRVNSHLKLYASSGAVLLRDQSASASDHTWQTIRRGCDARGRLI